MEISEWAAIAQTGLTGVLALLTYFYVKTTGRQLTAMREALEQTRRSNAATEKSNEIADRNLMLAHRSWLVPIPGKCIELSGDGTALISLINKGGTPCVLGNSAVYGIAMSVETLKDVATVKAMEFVIPADRYMDAGVGLPQGNDHKMVAQMPSLAEGSPDDAIIIILHIRYSDVFGKEWETYMAWRRYRSGGQWASMEGHSRFT